MSRIYREIRLFTVLFASILLSLAFSITVFAGNEVEKNDSFATANAFRVNSSTKGVLSSSKDSDFYKAYVSKAGYITVSMSRTPGDCHHIYLYDSNYEELWGSEYIYNEGTVTSPNIGLPAGNIYVVIEGKNTSSYSFKVNFTPAANWESEFNENFEQTNSISLNTICHGALRRKSDVDYFKTYVSKPGYIKFSMSRIPGEGYHFVYLYDSTYRELWRSEYINNEGTVTSPNIGLPAGNVYVRVSGGNTSNYSIKVNFTPAANWEREYNENFEQTNPISLNATYHGALANGIDVDYFKANVSKSGYITFSMSRVPGKNHTIFLYNSNYEELWRSGYRSSEGTVKSPNLSISSGNVYVVIDGDNTSDYSFKISYSAHSAQKKNPVKVKERAAAASKNSSVKKKIQKVSRKTKTIKVKYSKVKRKKQVIKKKKYLTLRGAVGKLTFKKVSGSRNLKITKKGSIIVKKGTKKGKYGIRIKITRAGNAKYYKLEDTVYVKVKVI